MTPPQMRPLGIAVLTLLLLASGCSDSTQPQRVPSSLTLSQTAVVLDDGATAQLTAELRDQHGQPFETLPAGFAVQWTSNNDAIASVGANGLVSGNQPGAARVTATAGTLSASADVTVREVFAIQLTGITPARLAEGQSATLTGGGFSPDPATNRVTIGGVAVTVTEASATTLQIMVPPGICLPAGNVEVRVTAGSLQSNPLRHPFQAEEFLSLQVGEQLIVRDPARFCLQFAPGGAEAYLIGVQSISEVVSSLTPVAFSAVAAFGTAGFAGAPSLAVAARAPSAAPPAVPTLSMEQRARLERHTAVEMRLRRWERQNMGPRMREALRRVPRPMGERLLSVPREAQLGDTIPIRFPDINRQDFCRDFIAIRTVVRYIGTRGIWLEDVANPAGGFTGADFQTLSAFFDESAYRTITDYFGEPTDLDENGKVVIVATQEVNRAGPLGFVVSTDFYPRTICPSSNEGEIYYSMVPDPQGTLSAARSREDVVDWAHMLIPHEFTHLIQFGRRLSMPDATSLPYLWEAEGQATLAEEIMGHALTGRQPGQNYGARVIFNDPQTTPFDWYLGAFSGLVQYYGFRSRTERAPNAPEQCSWLGRPEDQPGSACGGPGPIYGASWSFLRWLSDHYGPRFPGGERGLHQALIQNRFSGFQTIEEVIGVPIDTLLAQWAAMLYVDDRVPGAAPLLTLPSWNLFDFEQSVIETARLEPRQRTFSTFTDQVSVRAGATAYFRVGGGSRPATAIRARASANSPLPAHMRLWVVRLE